MRLVLAPLSIGLILIAFSSTLGQGAREVAEKGQDTAWTTADVESKTTLAAPAATQDNPSILVYLVGGGRMQVDELTERADGFWYKRGNVTTFLDRSRVERTERIKSPGEIQAAGSAATLEAAWSISESGRVENFFKTRFNRRLPLTAFGQSDLHTRWGLDHRQGVDVGVHPDSPEGKALIDFLRAEKIPFLAFRGPVPRVATGPHIHIGKGSHRLPARN